VSRLVGEIARGAPGAPILPMPLSEVHIATREDGLALIRFLMEIKDEISDGNAEEDLLFALAGDLVSRVGGIALVIRGRRDPKKIEASLGLVFSRPALRRAYYLWAPWNNVLPEARKTTGHGKSLLIAAQRFADNVRCPLRIEQWTEGPDPALAKASQTPKIRLCGRHLPARGAIFAYSPG
jgi:hypothetical protein